MERVRKSKTKPTLDSIFFVTPEQKLLRFLLSEPTTEFTPRVLSSKLKGVRGLGGVEGLNRILQTLHELGLLGFVNNNRGVTVHNDHLIVKITKALGAICDLESLKTILQPESARGVLYGSRANGGCISDSDYDLFVVSDSPPKVEQIVLRHPLGKKIDLTVWTPEDFLHIDSRDPHLAERLSKGMVLWGSAGW